jgi:DNA topoisomerase-1
LATVKRKRAPNGKVKPPPKKKVKKEEEGSEAMVPSASDDEPLTKKRSSGKAKVKPESDVEMKDVKPKRKRGPNKKGKEEDPSSETPQAKKKGKKKEEEDAEEVFRWWEEQANGDGEDKWQTLEHNGVIFPPPYEPLPSHVKMKYKGSNPVISCVLPGNADDSTQARR